MNNLNGFSIAGRKAPFNRPFSSCMYLKALKLHGFKSFADPTTPCNSNPASLPSSVRMAAGNPTSRMRSAGVLGEQSAKALRGGQMQDVIFEGADTRKVAQICEVSLLLTDCEKQLGSEFHEIEIMRRVHRDGQSEYSFNGQGLPAEGHPEAFHGHRRGPDELSIMAQARSTRSCRRSRRNVGGVRRRRRGITKYKSQRREAMQKLGVDGSESGAGGRRHRRSGASDWEPAPAGRRRRCAYKRINHRLAPPRAGVERLSPYAARRDARRTRKAGGHAAGGGGRTAPATSNTRKPLAEKRQSSQPAQSARAGRAAGGVRRALAEGSGGKRRQPRRSNAADWRTGWRPRASNLGEVEMQLREVSAQVDTGAQDKQLQLELLGGSDAVFQQRNRELAIVEGELEPARTGAQPGEVPFLLQLESTVARLRTGLLRLRGRSENQRAQARLARAGTRGRAAAAGGAARFAVRPTPAVKKRRRKSPGRTARNAGRATDPHRAHGEFREAPSASSGNRPALAQRTARLRAAPATAGTVGGFRGRREGHPARRLDAALAGREGRPDHLRPRRAALSSARPSRPFWVPPPRRSA